jgi:pyruvate/2-oxoglutarate dehydrogenase complex dihydrolipoamide acyltransferase (E2) component
VIEITAPAEPFQEAGEGVEGLLEAWLVDENDRVSAGQPVADAIVVKTSFQISAPCDGTIANIVVGRGDTFASGAVLAVVADDEGVDADAPSAAAGPSVGAPLSSEPDVAASSVGPPAAAADSGPLRVPLTGMRGAVAREMALAWQQPRVAIGVEVEMSAALAVLQDQRGDGTRLSPTHAVLRSVSLTLCEHPRLNSRVNEDAVELAPDVNLGLAVSLDEGVIVPVIRNADRKSLLELAAEAGELAQAARAGSLPGSALREGTFTVSTLGATGIDWFTPVLNPPQVAILGVGSVTERVIARDGAAVVAPTMVLTLIFDHRAVDGHPAALFLAAVRGRLERGDL